MKQEQYFWDRANEGTKLESFIEDLISKGYRIDVVIPTFYYVGILRQAIVIISKP